MTKFYNDLKAAETLHSTAATIIQGPLPPSSSQINVSEPVLVAKPSTADDSAKRESTSTTSDQQKKKRKIETVAVAKKPAAQLENRGAPARLRSGTPRGQPGGAGSAPGLFPLSEAGTQGNLPHEKDRVSRAEVCIVDYHTLYCLRRHRLLGSDVRNRMREYDVDYVEWQSLLSR